MFAVRPVHFVWEEFVLAPTAPYIVAIQFPSVNYTNEACGLFVHCSVQKLGQFLLFTCKFCHRENLYCSMHHTFVKSAQPFCIPW